MSTEMMKALLEAFDKSDWTELIVTVGEDRLHVSREPIAANGSGPPAAVGPPAPGPPASAAPPQPAAAAEAPAEAPAQAPAPASTAGPPEGTVVESPSVGLFWRAPSPNEPPFVEVGSRVAAGDTLAIVEVMKLMNHLTAPAAGVVTAILAENGAPVEYGQGLVVIDPEG